MADVAEHFRQWNVCFNANTACAWLLIFDHAATTVKVTDNITNVVFRSEDVNLHDRLKQLSTGFRHRLTECTFCCDFKRNRRGVNGVVATVEYVDFYVQYREASQRTFVHHSLEAFLDGWEEFLRNVTTHNRGLEHETRTWLTWLHAVINLTVLTRTTRLLLVSVAVFNR